MPKLPSSQDVDIVSPRIMSDPGVQAPKQAFESPLGVVASELAPAVDAFTQIALRQENRRDTVDRSDKINRYDRETQDELRRLNTESDLSREDVLREYGMFLSKKKSELLKDHGGSADSQTLLTTRLQDIEANATGRAAGLSTALGREKVLTTFNNGITPLATRVAQEPTGDSIAKAFTDLDTQITDLRGALDPKEEENLRLAGREQIALSAIDTLIARGRVETVAAMVDDPSLAQSLSPQVQRDVRRRIETVRSARDEMKRKVAEVEAVLKRPMEPDERIRFLGLEPKAPLVSIQNQGETARAKAEGEALAKITTEQLPNLRKQAGQLKAMENMLETGTETGGFKNLQLQAANFFGVTPESLNDLAAFRAVSNAATLTKTTELKGAISERELDFVQAAVASAGTGTEANKAILKIQGKLLQREQDTLKLMDRYHTANGRLTGFEDYLAQWANANPLFSEKEALDIQSRIIVQETQNGKGAKAKAKETTSGVIDTQEAYDALPDGSEYKGTDGKTYIKGRR